MFRTCDVIQSCDYLVVGFHVLPRIIIWENVFLSVCKMVIVTDVLSAVHLEGFRGGYTKFIFTGKIGLCRVLSEFGCIRLNVSYILCNKSCSIITTKRLLEKE